MILLFFHIGWVLCYGPQLIDREVKADSRKVIVDCDAGVDDIYAIQFLINEPNVNVLAVTT